MIKDQFARELAYAAENVKDHTVELICGSGPNEIWRCTNNGSSMYGFEIAISRFGIAMYGDVDSLVFKVGSSYGIEFLARKSVCGYMISKLEEEYRNKRELDEDALRAALFKAGVSLFHNKFVTYVADESEDFVETPAWIMLAYQDEKVEESLDDLLELMNKHASEQSHMKFEMFCDNVQHLLEESVPNGLRYVETYIGENYSELNLGCEWYELPISKHDSGLIRRLEMLRLCALKIQEVKNAGDGAEEHT